MKEAPKVGREVVEEIWFMSILSVTSFPRVYGRTASGPGDPKGARTLAEPFSFIRTVTVGSGIAPKSADPRL